MDEYRGRVRVFAAVVMCVIVLLTGRLAYMQLIQQDAFGAEASNNAIRENLVRPARGAIFDREGTLMVDNRPTYSVLLTPRYFPREEGHRAIFDSSRVHLLATLMSVPDSLVWAKLDEARTRNPDAPTRSFPEVAFDQFARVQENLFRLPGVTYEIRQTRQYHTDARASHALGYVREIGPRELERRFNDGYRRGDLMGMTGVERNYEMYLRGKLGTEVRLVNARGLDIGSFQEGELDAAPLSGYDLHLALDAGLQAIAEDLFEGKRGGVVAIDPRNGEILAMVSKPDYDLSTFTRSVNRETWHYLTQSPDKPMFNRATQSMQPPGSTWKMFMALLALQEGKITEETRINCPGYHPLGGGRMYRCLGRHGSIEVREAIQRSCNTFFFETMMRTDVNTFARYARMFTFGQRVLTDVAEQTPGLIPDSSYFNRAYPRGWTVGYSINLGVGQGDMGSTPFELARYAAILGNGGAYHPPHLIRELRHRETGELLRPTLPAPVELPIEARHFEVVRDGMRLVMEAGTGRNIQVPGHSSGGKTGTSQVGVGRQNNSVFVMFAPYDNPVIAIGIQVENSGYGGVVAGPIASLMAEYFLNRSIAPQRQAMYDRVRAIRSQNLSEGT